MEPGFRLTSSNSKRMRTFKPRTANVKRLIKERKRKARMLGSEINNEQRKREANKQILQDIKSIIEGNKIKVSHWHKDISDIRAKSSKKSENKEIKMHEEKITKLMTVLNTVLTHISREEKMTQTELSEIGRLKVNLEEFVEDALEEMNDIAKDSSIFVEKEDKTNDFGQLPKGKDSAKVIVSNMFRLYRYDCDTDPVALFKKKKTKK